ncbi:hypothetical protein, partial [Salmonella sp. SAL4436]|uniref:hypothetical protein n=1 Tax=Salmonella sp. SAL4436 TaxID=3159891 RepID=UPI003979769A
RVRKVDAETGIITTVAGDGSSGLKGDGGPATKASLTSPMGLALVPAGERVVVYVAVAGEGAVRVIARDGTISTLTTTRRFLAPSRLAYS